MSLPIPSFLTATTPVTYNIDLNWDEVGGASYYEVYEVIYNENDEVVAYVPETTVEGIYSRVSAPTGVETCYTIRAFNEYGGAINVFGGPTYSPVACATARHYGGSPFLMKGGSPMLIKDSLNLVISQDLSVLR